MLPSFLFLIVAFVLLMAGAEILVRGAAALALRMGLSSFFVGLTIVGFGTSTPELFTSVNAGLRRLPDISMGNIIGSNIFNLAVILGVTAVIAPIPINTRVVRDQILIMVAAAVLPFVVLFTGGVLTRPLGLAMIAALALFLYHGYRSHRGTEQLETAAEEELEAELGLGKTALWDRTWVCLAAVVAGIALLVLGSRLLIDASLSIARTLGVSELVIGLTVVAGGTSMPELFTSVTAALRHQTDISVGNIVGSNIFNILGIGGVLAAVYPQAVSRQVLWLDAPFMLFLSLAAVPIMVTGQRVSRVEGAFFLALYGAYLVVLFAFAPGWFGPRVGP